MNTLFVHRRSRIAHASKTMVCIFFCAVLAAACSSLKPNDQPPLVDAGCARLADRATDIFVVHGATQGTGTRECPFGTIGEAISAAAQSSAREKTITIGAGTFDAETFPLRLPAGVSLVGGGAEPAAHATVVKGGAEYTVTGPFAGVYRATFVVGDADGSNRISSLSIVGADAGTDIGVVCERGNSAPNASTTPAPNVVLEDVGLRHYTGHGAAIFVTASGAAAGCNLRMAASRIDDASQGIRVAGCADKNLDAGSAATVALEVGDGTDAGGTTLHGIRGAVGDGIGIIAGDCVSRLSVQRATFIASDAGLEIVQHALPTIFNGHIEILDSHFLNLTTFGVAINADSVVDNIERNEFRAITTRSTKWATSFFGIGLALDDSLYRSGAGSPTVRKARDNVFTQNDFALMVRGASSMSSDLGRVSDPGKNTFRCSAQADVAVVADRRGSGTLMLAGNIWDHVPVVPQLPENAIAGEDFVSKDLAVPADVSGAQADSTPCPRQ